MGFCFKDSFPKSDSGIPRGPRVAKGRGQSGARKGLQWGSLGRPAGCFPEGLRGWKTEGEDFQAFPLRTRNPQLSSPQTESGIPPAEL